MQNSVSRLVVVVVVVVAVQRQPTWQAGSCDYFPGLMKIRLHLQTLHLAVLRKRVNVTKRDSAANELGMKRGSFCESGRPGTTMAAAHRVILCSA